MKSLGIAVLILVFSLSLIGYCIAAGCLDEATIKQDRIQEISFIEN